MAHIATELRMSELNSAKAPHDDLPGGRLTILAEMEARLRRYVRMTPAIKDNTRVYKNLGNVYARLRRIKDAVSCYQQALAIQPGFVEVHHNLGSALMQLQRYPEAIASLQQCITLQPDFVEGRIKLEQAMQALQLQESSPQKHD